MASLPLRRSKGRQRVPMELMAKDSNRYVTFSKRRAGLFKKGSELCTLCGVEAALIVFSPGKKVFSFGHPYVDDIVNRYLFHQHAVEQNPGAIEAEEEEVLKQLNKELTLSKAKIELEMKKTEQLQEFRKAMGDELFKFTTPEQLTLEELKQIKLVLEPIRDSVYHYKELLDGHLNPHYGPFLGQEQGYPIEGQSFSYQQAMFGGQGVMPDPNPGPETFGDLSQMANMPPPLVRGPNDYTPVMIPTPTMGVYQDPPLDLSSGGMQQFHDSNYAPSNMQNMMGAGFSHPGMIPPPLQMAPPLPPYPVEGHFHGHQGMPPSSMQMNTGSGGYFTNLLMYGENGGPAPPAPPAPYNPQGGYGFGPRMP